MIQPPEGHSYVGTVSPVVDDREGKSTVFGDGQTRAWTLKLPTSVTHSAVRGGRACSFLYRVGQLMKRAGHVSPAAALRYQHASADRDRVIADALSELATSTKVVELRRTKDGRKSRNRVGRQAG